MKTTYTYGKKIDQSNNCNINFADDSHMQLLMKIKSLEEEINKLKEQANIDQLNIEDDSIEIDRLNSLLREEKENVSMWMSKYEEVEENSKKARHERDILKEILHNKPETKQFTVRQTAIIAYALCKKGGFIPKNKKNISTMFQDMTGRSANTLGMNLCSTYTDDEIEEIAVAVEKDMPEFACYLREKTFFYPEMKK